MKLFVVTVAVTGVLSGIPLMAQGPPLAPAQLDTLVEPVALYPDPLLAQTLTASTYWDQIPEAAPWADAHNYLNGQGLANAIQSDQLPWDPSVLALLPFPSVLDQMAQDPGWTQSLGNAVLSDRGGVMDAVQRMRQEAMSNGYLQSNQYYRVTGGPYVEILPVAAGYYYVPRYNPAVIFTRRARRAPGAVITFGPRVRVGAFFEPFGWREPGFSWREHNIVIDHRPWVRSMQNREHYQHAYSRPVRRPEHVEHFTGEHRGPAFNEHHDRARRNENNRDHDRGRGHGRGRGPDHQ